MILEGDSNAWFWRRNLIEGNHCEDKGYTGKILM
jgi:hypothetical protein